MHRFGQPGTQPAPLQRVNFDALIIKALHEQAIAVTAHRFGSPTPLSENLFGDARGELGP